MLCNGLSTQQKKHKCAITTRKLQRRTLTHAHGTNTKNKAHGNQYIVFMYSRVAWSLWVMHCNDEVSDAAKDVAKDVVQRLIDHACSIRHP